MQPYWENTTHHRIAVKRKIKDEDTTVQATIRYENRTRVELVKCRARGRAPSGAFLFFCISLFVILLSMINEDRQTKLG